MEGADSHEMAAFGGENQLEQVWGGEQGWPQIRAGECVHKGKPRAHLLSLASSRSQDPSSVETLRKGLGIHTTKVIAMRWKRTHAQYKKA